MEGNQINPIRNPNLTRQAYGPKGPPAPSDLPPPPPSLVTPPATKLPPPLARRLSGAAAPIGSPSSRTVIPAGSVHASGTQSAPTTPQFSRKAPSADTTFTSIATAARKPRRASINNAMTRKQGLAIQGIEARLQVLQAKHDSLSKVHFLQRKSLRKKIKLLNQTQTEVLLGPGIPLRAEHILIVDQLQKKADQIEDVASGYGHDRKFQKALEVRAKLARDIAKKLDKAVYGDGATAATYANRGNNVLRRLESMCPVRASSISPKQQAWIDRLRKTATLYDAKLQNGNLPSRFRKKVEARKAKLNDYVLELMTFDMKDNVRCERMEQFIANLEKADELRVKIAEIDHLIATRPLTSSQKSFLKNRRQEIAREIYVLEGASCMTQKDYDCGVEHMNKAIKLEQKVDAFAAKKIPEDHTVFREQLAKDVAGLERRIKQSGGIVDKRTAKALAKAKAELAKLQSLQVGKKNSKIRSAMKQAAKARELVRKKVGDPVAEATPEQLAADEAAFFGQADQKGVSARKVMQEFYSAEVVFLGQLEKLRSLDALTADERKALEGMIANTKGMLSELEPAFRQLGVEVEGELRTLRQNLEIDLARAVRESVYTEEEQAKLTEILALKAKIGEVYGKKQFAGSSEARAKLQAEADVLEKEYDALMVELNALGKKSGHSTLCGYYETYTKIQALEAKVASFSGTPAGIFFALESAFTKRVEKQTECGRQLEAAMARLLQTGNSRAMELQVAVMQPTKYTLQFKEMLKNMPEDNAWAGRIEEMTATVLRLYK